MAISSIVPDTKYGNTISAKPQTSGTIARCFLPYRKKPNPIDPNRTPQSSVDAFKATSSALAGMVESYSTSTARSGQARPCTFPVSAERASLLIGNLLAEIANFFVAR